MGTRSLTRVFDNDKQILCMYRQMDGYPSGHGAELADFLASGALVNGYTMGTKERQFNGAGCLAAQMICEFKQGKVGGIYIYPIETDDSWQDYEYHVHIKHGQIRVIVYEGKASDQAVIFDGDVPSFNSWCNKE